MEKEKSSRWTRPILVRQRYNSFLKFYAKIQAKLKKLDGNRGG